MVACNLVEQMTDQILQSTRVKIEQVLIQRENIAMCLDNTKTI